MEETRPMFTEELRNGIKIQETDETFYSVQSHDKKLVASTVVTVNSVQPSNLIKQNLKRIIQSRQMTEGKAELQVEFKKTVKEQEKVAPEMSTMDRKTLNFSDELSNAIKKENQEMDEVADRYQHQEDVPASETASISEGNLQDMNRLNIPAGSGSKESKKKNIQKKKNISLHKENSDCNGARQFKCQLCEKIFCHKSSLQQHQSVHTGAKPFTCELCHKGFAQPQHLKIHLAMHSGHRPFKCELCCKRFIHKSNLKAHLAVHIKDKSFQCEICHRGFVCSSNLKKHLAVHVKSFQCHICSNQYSSCSYLKKHIAMHTIKQDFNVKQSKKHYIVIMKEAHTKISINMSGINKLKKT